MCTSHVETFELDDVFHVLYLSLTSDPVLIVEVHLDPLVVYEGLYGIDLVATTLVYHNRPVILKGTFERAFQLFFIF